MTGWSKMSCFFIHENVTDINVEVHIALPIKIVIRETESHTYKANHYETKEP